MVLKIVSEKPTAVPVFASVKETPNKLSAVPLVCLIQFNPAFVVLIIIP